MKKRVAVFIPTLETGGAEKLALDLVSKINKDEFETILVSLFPKKNTIYEEIAKKRGISVIYLNKRPGLDIFTFSSVWKLLQSFKPDIVHTHIYTASYVFPWMIFHNKVNWIHTIHSVASKELYSFHKNLMKFTYKNYRNFRPIAISDEIKKSIVEEYSVNSEKIFVIHNGIDRSEFKLELLNKNCSIVLEFICVARFSDVKNHRMLINAFGKLLIKFPKSRLTLVGDGEEKKEIELLTKTLGISEYINFVGQTSNVQFYLSSADIFVLTSKYEGLPLSILEAMSVGLPIIATEVGGIPDVIKNEVNGLLVNSGDTEALFRAMCKLATDQELREKMKVQNIQDSSKYDLNYIAKSYEEIYKNNAFAKKGLLTNK